MQKFAEAELLLPDTASGAALYENLSHSLPKIHLLAQQNRQNFYFSSSTIDNKGCFARRNLFSGEIVISAYGFLTSQQSEQHSVQQSLNTHLEPFEWGGKYLNHSCEGNLIVRSDPEGFTRWVAARPIQEHEELNYHYALTELTWSPVALERRITCRCGSSSCDGMIRSFDMLSYQEQKEIVKQKSASFYLQEWFRTQIK